MRRRWCHPLDADSRGNKSDSGLNMNSTKAKLLLSVKAFVMMAAASTRMRKPVLGAAVFRGRERGV